MITIQAAALRQLTLDIYRETGAPEDVARVVSTYQVDTNLYGHDSHGCIAVPRFVSDVHIGKIVPDARPEVVRESGPTALYNGRRSYGTFAVHTAVNLAIEKARTHGIGAVGITNCNHAGAIYGWVKMIVDEGMIGLVICSAGPRGGSMVPFGGIGKALAGNPIGFGVPGGATGPMIADFSTARAAGGKVLMALQSGDPIPEDWVFDAEGKPTTDPAAFMTPDLEITGMMRPFGGHKGYAIAMFAEVLGAILTGYGPAYKDDYIEGNGTFIIAIDVPPFIDLEVFRQEVDGLFSKVKSVPTEDGVDEVLIPGEMEARTRAQREADGVPFPDGTWQTIADTANEIGVTIPPVRQT